jgi:hypothetical protein
MLAKDYVGSSETNDLALRVHALCDFLREEGSFHGLHLPQDAVDVHGLSDDEYMHRQQLRTVFHSIDNDGNGALDADEFNRMLKLIGARITPLEVKAVFAYIDADSSGFVSFDEFYMFCQANVPDRSPGRAAPARRSSKAGH